MGRVYNALVKAEKWGGQQDANGGQNKPQSSPAHSYAPPRSAPEAAPASVGGGRDADSSEDSVADYESNSAPWRTLFYAETTTARSFGLTDDFGLSAGLIDPPAASFPRAVPTPALRVPTATALKPALEPPVVFEEPRKTRRVDALSIDPHLVALNGSDVLASERYRTLAVRLFNMASRRKLKTLLVSSAQPGEGKSTVATNLAWVMAKRSERRVLLLDADLRGASVGRALGIDHDRGWFDLLEGTSQARDVTVRLDPNGLYVMLPRSSRELKHDVSYAGIADALTSARLESLLRDLERYFDF